MKGEGTKKGYFLGLQNNKKSSLQKWTKKFWNRFDRNNNGTLLSSSKKSNVTTKKPPIKIKWHSTSI